MHKQKHGECFSQFEWNNGHAMIQHEIEILAPIKILLDSLENENKKANKPKWWWWSQLNINESKAKVIISFKFLFLMKHKAMN